MVKSSDRAQQLCEKYSVDQAMGEPASAIDEAIDTTMKFSIDLLEFEFGFHYDNKGITSKGADWEDGFINGLVHARNVLIKAQAESCKQAAFPDEEIKYKPTHEDIQKRGNGVDY